MASGVVVEPLVRCGVVSECGGGELQRVDIQPNSWLPTPGSFTLTPPDKGSNGRAGHLGPGVYVVRAGSHRLAVISSLSLRHGELSLECLKDSSSSLSTVSSCVGNTSPGWAVARVANRLPSYSSVLPYAHAGTGPLDRAGGDAHHAVVFPLDSKSYEIDLSESNFERFRSALKPYAEKARTVGRRSPDLRGSTLFSGHLRMRNLVSEHGAKLPDTR